MKLIGVALYQHLLEGALRQAHGKTIEEWSPELNLGINGSLPSEWIPEPELRVELYARLARSRDVVTVDALEEEFQDRFGPLPLAADTLMAISRLRCVARGAEIARIDAGPGAIALTPRKAFVADAAAAGLVAKNGRLILDERLEDASARIARISDLLEQLAPMNLPG
jgi:transcription-repair coupling factor (superfamily II helicase)